MDNASIVDIVLIAVLLAGAVIGAVRGLFRSLMGLAVVIAAIVGSLWLANLMTEPVTDIVAPKVEDAAVRKFGALFEAAVQEGSGQALESIRELLAQYRIDAGKAEKLLDTTRFSADSEKMTERAEEAFRNTISDALRKAVRGTVHTVLVLVLYIVLLIVLKLLVRLLDLAFDLPVLSTVNGVGGALLGLLEAAALLFVAVHIADGLGVELVTGHADDSLLLPFFLNRSPIQGIVSISR